MERLIYCEMGTNTVSAEVGTDGGSFAFPELTVSEVLVLRLRFAQSLDGTAREEVFRTLRHVRAGIGRLDAGADFGQWAVKIGPDPATVGVNAIPPQAHDVSAEALQSALGALSGISAYGAPSVHEDGGSWIVTFADATAEVPIQVSHNSLSPLCRVRTRAHVLDGIWYHELRLVQEKAAFTSSIEYNQIPAPVVSEYQVGGDFDGTRVDEVQKISFSQGFRGLYRIKRGERYTDYLNEEDGPEELQEALAPLADEGGEFVVTRPASNVGHIWFSGSMGGQPQDLLEVVDVQAPPPDAIVRLNLNTWQCAALMRGAAVREDRLTLPFQLEVDYEDPQDAEKVITWIFQTPVTLRRDLIYENEAELDTTDHLRPIDPTSHVPFTVDQVGNGNDYYAFVIGDGVAAEFLIDHQLHTKRVDVDLRENTAGGAWLVPGRDFDVTYDPGGTGEDSIVITLLGDYASNPPAAGGIFGTVVSREMTSFFDPHHHTIPQVENLEGILADYADRLAALEAKTVTAGQQMLSSGSGTMPVLVPPVWRVMRERTQPEMPESLTEWAPGPDVRPKRLQPAVHYTGAALPLPMPLPAASADYRDKIYNSAVEREDFPGILTAGGHAACDGREWYRVERSAATETTWYPLDFEVELFRFAFGPGVLPTRAEAKGLFGMQLLLRPPERRVSQRRSAAAWTLLLELGEWTSKTVPPPTGSNLDRFFTDPKVILRQDIILTEVPTWTRFGFRFRRDGVGDVTAAVTRLYREEVAPFAPSVPDFAVRARLVRWDVEDWVSDARGIVAVRGLDVGEDGRAAADLGRLVIES